MTPSQLYPTLSDVIVECAHCDAIYEATSKVSAPCPECGLFPTRPSNSKLSVGLAPATVGPFRNLYAVVAPPIRPVPSGSGGHQGFCPSCGYRLSTHQLADVLVSECIECHGVFIDNAAVKRLLAENLPTRANAIIAAYANIPRAPRNGVRTYVKCPTCDEIMNRRSFAHRAQIIIDTCRPHGTWFDAGELSAAIQFVADGGLERASKFEQAEKAKRLRQAEQDSRFDSGAQTVPRPFAHESEHKSSTMADSLLRLLGELLS